MLSPVPSPRLTCPFKLVCPATVNVPSVDTLPELDATVNLSVVPDLTAKFASTSTVLLNSDVLVTVRVPLTLKLPPSVELPLATLSAPPDCMSSPNPFLSCKSPAPSVHVEPDALPPVISKLPVSVSPNFAHAAPVQ